MMIMIIVQHSIEEIIHAQMGDLKRESPLQIHIATLKKITTIMCLVLLRLLMLYKNIRADNLNKWKKIVIWRSSKSRYNLMQKGKEVCNVTAAINKIMIQKAIKFLINFNQNLRIKRCYRIKKNQQLSIQIEINANHTIEAYLPLKTSNKH